MVRFSLKECRHPQRAQEQAVIGTLTALFSFTLWSGRSITFQNLRSIPVLYQYLLQLPLFRTNTARDNQYTCTLMKDPITLPLTGTWFFWQDRHLRADIRA